MSELHEALKAIAPADWGTIPQGKQDLESYLDDLFSNCQLIIDSVPLPAPDDAPQKPQAQASGQAANASDVTLSAERSAAGTSGHEKVQKEWGKPVKIKPQENPLGISVYKMSGKDSRGAWFSRHSVHEGVGFSKFKKSMQMEFEKSLSEPGPPGTGSVRGIGGEERLEQIKTDKGTVEVFRLTAQFPGPTAPRDFVTLLITSDKAIHVENESNNAPRHYLVVSRPCDHPKTQPTSDFVRGFYESIEFIREVPRKVSKLDSKDPEDNPVEWMMITRSDPGGGIPRFLVERGTPGSITGDAVKFVDWATQNEDDLAALESKLDKGQADGGQADDGKAASSHPPAQRKESYQSWKGRSVVGVVENQHEDPSHSQQYPQPAVQQQPATAQTQHNGSPRTLAPPPNGLSRAETHDSFDTASEGLSSSENEDAEKASMDSVQSPVSIAGSRQHGHHEDKVRKLDEKKQALYNKFAETQAKFEQSRSTQPDTDEAKTQKLIDKHEKDLKKHEEKFQKDLAKVEHKQEKERRKAAEKAKKRAEKADKAQLVQERDEARLEADKLRKVVENLQKENAAMVAKLGSPAVGPEAVVSRSRGTSLSKMEKK